MFGKLRETIVKIRLIPSDHLGKSWSTSLFGLIILCFTDADECADGSHDCDVNADCNNIAGSYTCSCKPTYFGNGKYCTSFRKFYVCQISRDCIN